MRRLFFHVLIAISTIPASHARTTKLSAMLAANEERPRFRVRSEIRMMIGTRATVMSVQSKAMKPAFGMC